MNYTQLVHQKKKAEEESAEQKQILIIKAIKNLDKIILVQTAQSKILKSLYTIFPETYDFRKNILWIWACSILLKLYQKQYFLYHSLYLLREEEKYVKYMQDYSNMYAKLEYYKEAK